MARIACLFLFLAAALPPCHGASGPCYPNPQAAIERSGAPTAGGAGYRVEFAAADPFLGRTWVSLARCEHPDWPLLTVAGPAIPRAAAQPRSAVDAGTVVRIGATVRVVLNDSRTRLEMPAMAQENGRVGDRIRVRLLRISPELPEQSRTAIVRGPEDLEMVP